MHKLSAEPCVFAPLWFLKQDMESSSNTDLPADIIRNILLRLPVKILSQFKCVCKEWYTLVESQSFITEHFVSESNQERLLVFKPDRDRLIYADHEEPDHVPMPGRVYDVMGPVNGVFCLVSTLGGTGLLNPALKQFKPLPFLTPRSLSRNYIFGFGLDPSSGCFKVVFIEIFLIPQSNPPPPIVHVYNSGSDSWRRLANVDMLSSLQYSSSCTYLNGVCYWDVYFRVDGCGFGLLAFDMRSDEFQIIQLPYAIKKHLLEPIPLEFAPFVYGDSIVILSFIISSDHDATFIDMWVLGNDGRWIKRSTFGPFGGMRWPLGFWKNNELMLDTDNAFVTTYNISTRELRHVEAREKMVDFVSHLRTCVYTYKESLLSMTGDCKFWDISSAFVNDFFKDSFS